MTRPRKLVRALLFGVALAAAQATAATVVAQPTMVRLRGIAWDSVASRPLIGAFIALDGARSTRSDSSGAFAFDSVRLGIHDLALDHAVLDSMGLAGIATRVTVVNAFTFAEVAVPRFATLWRAACGDRVAPADSGFVYGTVRAAQGGEGVAGARVTLSWIDLTLVNAAEYRQRRYRAENETDANGEYAICGVPVDTGLELQAEGGAAASAPTTVGSTMRVRRRDLLIGLTDSATAPRGSVAGIVTHADGRPFAGATVVLDDAAPQSTGQDGRFAFGGVLTGTRQLEVLAIGARPRTEVVEVRPGERTNVLVAMMRLTTLDVVRVIGTRWQLRALEELADRMSKAHGQFRDSMFLKGRQVMPAVFAGLRGTQLSMAGRGGAAGDIASVTMARGCAATVFIDGYREVSFDGTPLPWLNRLKPEEIAMMEVYDRPELVPYRFSTGGGDTCGVVAIWTKAMVP